MKQFVLIFTLMMAAWGLSAQSPIGVWETIDDNTGKAKSYVEIYEDNGKLYGKIKKIIDPAKQDRVCEKCTGDQKDQPVLGMQILTDMKKSGKTWSGGKILDPESGSLYTCKIWLDGENTLKVRGYIAFLYRTQTWNRIK